MGKFRGTDSDPGWINRRLRDLQRQIDEQRAAKRLPGTEVPEGGNFLVRGLLSVIGTLDLTGDLSMKSAAGDEVVRMGEMPHGDRGLEFNREDGTNAFNLRKPLGAGDPQVWALRDRAATSIVEENAFGIGLGKPFLEHPFQPYAATSGTAVTCGPYGLERTTRSSSFETLFVYDGKAQNYFIDLKLAAVCSDGTTAGEVRVVDMTTGVPRPGFALPAWLGSIPTGTTSHLILDPTSGEVLSTLADVGVGGQMRLGVQARRTAGTGTITLSVAQAIGG